MAISLKQTMVALGLTTALAMSAQAADYTLKLHHFLPKQAPAHKNLAVSWKEAIEKQSNGRIEVKLYAGMQLGGKAPNLVDQVKDGFVDVVWTLPGYTPGRFPAISVFELPFMVSNAESTSQALQAYYEANASVQEEFKDVHPLFFFTHDRGAIHTKEKVVKTLADLDGLKIRIPSRPVADAMVAYGATPVSMAVPQMPEALSKNVIDGTVVPWEVVPAFRLHELANSTTEILSPNGRGLYTSVFAMLMNKKKYESMPDDLKKVIDDNSGMSWSKAMGKVWVDAEKPGRAMAEKRGNSLQSLPEEDVVKMQISAKPVLEAWAKEMDEKGMDGSALLESAQTLLDKYTAE